MSVFVEKEGEQWTRMNIKTTPSMLLKQVAEQAQAKLVPSQSAFSYGLRSVLMCFSVLTGREGGREWVGTEGLRLRLRLDLTLL